MTEMFIATPPNGHCFHADKLLAVGQTIRSVKLPELLRPEYLDAGLLAAETPAQALAYNEWPFRLWQLDAELAGGMLRSFSPISEATVVAELEVASVLGSHGTEIVFFLNQLAVLNAGDFDLSSVSVKRAAPARSGMLRRKSEPEVIFPTEVAELSQVKQDIKQSALADAHDGIAACGLNLSKVVAQQLFSPFPFAQREPFNVFREQFTLNVAEALAALFAKDTISADIYTQLTSGIKALCGIEL